MKFLKFVTPFLVLLSPWPSLTEDIEEGGLGNEGRDGKALSDQNDLTLSVQQGKILQKFKKDVEPYLYKDRFKSESYLVRFLRISRWDPTRAKSRLLENFRWRSEYKMDTINQEDWSDYEAEFPYTVEIVDKEGRPVLISGMGSWDFRSVILSGQRDKMLRYIFKMLDDLELAVIKAQNEGKEITRGQMIVDVAGYNVRQHGCPGCILMYLEMTRKLETSYPLLVKNTVLINTPSLFEAVFNLIRGVLTAESQETFKVLGTDKKRWQSFLRRIISEDQLPKEYGGKNELSLMI